jgi:hypothetical protein
VVAPLHCTSRAFSEDEKMRSIRERRHAGVPGGAIGEDEWGSQHRDDREVEEPGGDRMKLWIVRIALILALGCSVTLGAVAGVTTFFLAAYVVDSLAVLSLSAAAAFVLVAGGVAALAGRTLLPRGRPSRFWVPAGATGVGLLVVGLLWSALVLEPMDFPYVGMEPTEETRYWDLPTESRIAWTVTPAEHRSDRPPVIYFLVSDREGTGASTRPAG